METAVNIPVRSRWPGALAAVACLAGAVYLGAAWRDENRLRDASALARAGDYRAAIEEARDVTRTPARVRALTIEATALLALGDPVAASDAYARAADAAPNDAEIRRGWATALLRSGRRAAAERQYARAVTLNPGMVLPPGFRR